MATAVAITDVTTSMETVMAVLSGSSRTRSPSERRESGGSASLPDLGSASTSEVWVAKSTPSMNGPPGHRQL